VPFFYLPHIPRFPQFMACSTPQLLNSNPKFDYDKLWNRCTSVYQSADKYHNGRITKRGSKVAMWILTQISHAASRKKNSKLKEFFNRKKKSVGHSKAIIALARKIATIIWHLITNNEMYEDETGYQKGEVQKRKIVETEIFSVDERITIISEILAIMGKQDEEST
jgi:transposase